MRKAKEKSKLGARHRVWGGGQQGQCSLPGPEKLEGFSSPEALLQSSELRAPSLLSAQGQGKLQTWHSEEGGQETGEQSGEKARCGGGRPERNGVCRRREKGEQSSSCQEAWRVKVRRDLDSQPPQLGPWRLREGQRPT